MPLSAVVLPTTPHPVLAACAGPTAYFGLMNCVMRHDIKDAELGNMSEALPHLVLDGFSSKLGTRVSNILKHLFPVPKDDRRAGDPPSSVTLLKL